MATTDCLGLSGSMDSATTADLQEHFRRQAVVNLTEAQRRADASRRLPTRFGETTSSLPPAGRAPSAAPRRLQTDDVRIARAVFTLRETARYLGESDSTLRRWASERDTSMPLITRFPVHGRKATVPFIGFAEAYVLSAFRSAGVPIERIRPAVEMLASGIGIEHALASKRLYTDGAEVLYDYAVSGGDLELGGLTVVRTGQREFGEVVRDYLKRVTYGDDGWASSLLLPGYERAEVVIDPLRAGGRPIIAHNGASIQDLVRRFATGSTLVDVSTTFGVPIPEVEDVIRVAAAK